MIQNIENPFEKKFIIHNKNSQQNIQPSYVVRKSDTCNCIKNIHIEALKEYAKSQLFLLNFKDNIKGENSAKDYENITDRFQKEKKNIKDVFASKNISNVNIF